MTPHTLPLLLLLALDAPRADEFVELSRDALQALLPAPAVPDPLPPAHDVTDRTVLFTHTDEGTRLTARWSLRVRRPEWVRLRVVGKGVDVTASALGGRAIELIEQHDGWYLVAWLDRSTELVVEGRLEQDPTRAPIALELLTSVSGRIALDAPGLTLATEEATFANGTWWTGTDHLPFQLVPERSRARGPLVQLLTDVGLTVGDADVRGRARLTWLVRGSAVEEVRVRLVGVGDDLQLTGPLVTSVRREGDVAVLSLSRPVLGQVSVDARWSMPLSGGVSAQIAVPELTLPGGADPDAVLLVSRDDAVEVVPQLPGARPTSARALASRTDGLAEGTPTAAFERVRGGSLLVQRFQPVELPAVVVDVADWQVALSLEGRALLQGALTVRNERGSHLDVLLPEGARVIAVQVDGRPVTVALTPGGLRIPLPRSVETVQGPLAFPVDLAVVVDGGRAWGRRELWELPLPALGAETAVRRVTLSLPRGWRGRFEEGRDGLVDGFSEGAALAYGFGAGALEAEAQARYRQALSAWMDNDMEAAQAQIDTLIGLGLSNDNVERLQANLDVTRVDGNEAVDDAAARRIRSQARARASDESIRQEVVLREAEQRYAEGDYAEAERLYSEGVELTEKLATLEEEESVEQEEYKSRAVQGLSAAREVMDKRKKGEEAGERDRRNVTGVGEGGGGAGYVGRTAIDVGDDFSVDFALVPTEQPMFKPNVEPVADQTEFEDLGLLEPEPVTILRGAKLDDAEGDETDSYRLDGEPKDVPDADVVISGEFLERVPTGRTFSQSVQTTTRTSRRPAASETAPSAPPPPPVAADRGPAPPPDPAPAKRPAPTHDLDAGPALTATPATLIPPRFGEEVLFQHLLIPAGEHVPLLLSALYRPRSQP
jgi:hypothetical protein